MEQQFTYFWKSDSPFSNWFISPFKIADVQFNCIEQYMMYEKAMLFDDRHTASLILDQSEPREQKSLGRQIKGFKEDIWNEFKERIVIRGLRAKFQQNKEILKHLKYTSPTTLVEASPYDTIWGAGLDEEGCKMTPPEDWLGENLLGKLLTKVRNEL